VISTKVDFGIFWCVLIFLGEIMCVASKEQASYQRDEGDLRLDAARIPTTLIHKCILAPKNENKNVDHLNDL